MKVALVNPAWRFDNSIYFGCREPHLPLELGYCQRVACSAPAIEAQMFDGHLLDGLDNAILPKRSRSSART